jgi:hypothetical protein
MRYVLLVYDHPDALADLSEAERQAVYSEYESLSEIAGLVGHRLQHPATATTLRLRAGEPELQRGPFAEDSMPLAGFYLLECADLDGAVEIAGRIPAARLGGAVGIRPLVAEP